MLLVDGQCASDCEWLTYLLASRPHTLIVGENTYGVAQFTQPHYFVLPNSRVPFRIASGVSDFYGYGRSIDGYGFDVDILLSTEGDWDADFLTSMAIAL